MNKTLKKRIHNYVNVQGDICCEDDYHRDEIIQEIIRLYKEITVMFNEKGVDYLEHVDNDILKFVGYLSDMKEKKNNDGVKLYKYIDKQLKTKGKLDEKKLIIFLNNVPLYYLLSFMGKVYISHNQWKTVFQA